MLIYILNHFDKHSKYILNWFNNNILYFKGDYSMVKIVTDSTSYLTCEDCAKYDISIVSLGVQINNNIRREVDISNESFYPEMESHSQIPTSSQPTPDEMYTVFENIVSKGDSVVAILLSSEMSGTYSSAHTIKSMILENYPGAQIEIIDSRTNCMQLGFIVIEAAKTAQNGGSINDVISTANFVISNSRFLFTPDSLTYLKKGGRIGGAVALLGNLLQIKPILTVKDGQTEIFTKVRTKKKAIDAIINGLLEDLSSHELGDIVVHHINCMDEGLELANRLENTLGKKVSIQSIGPVIGVHVGPGSIGIAYHYK